MKEKCFLCDQRQTLETDDVAEHMIVLLYGNGHVHVHAPLTNKDAMEKIIRGINKEYNKTSDQKKKIIPKKI